MRTAICPTQLHFRKLASHFVGLTSGDRFSRCGWVATDVDIVAYVESLFVSAASVFAVVEPETSQACCTSHLRTGARTSA
jgi:hypothetical protein